MIDHLDDLTARRDSKGLTHAPLTAAPERGITSVADIRGAVVGDDHVVGHAPRQFGEISMLNQLVVRF